MMSANPVFASWRHFTAGDRAAILNPLSLAGMGAVKKVAAARPAAPADDYANTTTAAYALAFTSTGSASASGKINYVGDVDVFSVVAPATGTMTVTVSAPSGKTGVVPQLTAYDASGAKLVSASGAISSKKVSRSFQVAAGGKYFLMVSGLNSSTGSYSLQASATVPAPVPSPTPTPTPAPAPTLPGFLPSADAYTAATVVTGQALDTASGQVLVVRGTDAADTITLSQSGDVVTVATATGSQSFTGAWAGIGVYGFAGDDTLRLDNTIAQGLVTVVYAGAGNDMVFEAGTDAAFLYGQDGNDTLISVGGKADVLYGGVGLDSFWCDSTDTLADVESAETAAKSVHKITSFVQPTTTSNITLEINGQTLVQPAAGYAYANFGGRPLWADGPQFNDIIQGQLADCYFLAGLSGLADTDPALVKQAITALGDGSFAVRFFSGGTERYYRVDAQLPASGGSPAYARLTRNGGALWAPLLEKAFAQFRSAENSYSSLAYGWMDEAYRAITGASYSSVSSTGYTANTLAQNMANSLAAGHAVTAGSLSAAPAPIVSSHAYNVHAVINENGAWYVTVYNPWGVDGNSYDFNSGDGLLKLTASQFQASFSAVATCNA